MVTINQLVEIVEEIAGVKLKRNYKLEAPKGVRGRNSDNSLIKAKLGWARHPSSRRDGADLSMDLQPSQGAARGATLYSGRSLSMTSKFCGWSCRSSVPDHKDKAPISPGALNADAGHEISSAARAVSPD